MVWVASDGMGGWGLVVSGRVVWGGCRRVGWGGVMWGGVGGGGGDSKTSPLSTPHRKLKILISTTLLLDL